MNTDSHKLRTFEFNFGDKVIGVNAPEHCCLFCFECTDFWFNLEDGIYLTACNKCYDNTTGFLGNCEHFNSLPKVKYGYYN